MPREGSKMLILINIFFILAAIFSSMIQNVNIFFICVLITSIYMMVKFKDKPTNKDILISVVLGNLAGLYGMVTADFIRGPLVIVMVMAGYMAAVGIFRDYNYNDKVLRKSPVKSIGWGLILGIILGIFNLKMAGGDIVFKFDAEAIASALQAGIWEEVSMRFFFYALAIFILKGNPTNKFESVLVYIIMIVPHVLAHGMMDIASFIYLFLFFGLPMAILQRKVDLTSSIIMHTIVDIIRFTSLGV